VQPSVRDLAGNALDQNGNGIFGEASDTYTNAATLGATSPPVTPPIVGTAERTFNAGVPRAINAGRTTRVEISVNEDLAISSVSLGLDLSYARMGDIQLRLTSPTGQRVTLFNRRGSSSANLTGTTFIDGGTSLAAAAAPYRGNIQPEQSLSAFRGVRSRGVWILEIFSFNNTITGTLNSATLRLARV
jgi:subtilisin-like proprotein convertase family protein